MYKSKEIRWFKNNLDKSILDWFSKSGQTFENTSPRTDFYLPLEKDDITVKLREGNIEIKHRIGDVIKGNLTTNAEGIFENYVKWSFTADKADELSQQITETNHYNWTEIKKTRIGVKLIRDSDGKLKTLPIKTIVDWGCQVEYTYLIIDGKAYYTFALEWFGDKQLELDSKLPYDILDATRFDISASMGYGGFLLQL